MALYAKLIHEPGVVVYLAIERVRDGFLYSWANGSFMLSGGDSLRLLERVSTGLSGLYTLRMEETPTWSWTDGAYDLIYHKQRPSGRVLGVDRIWMKGGDEWGPHRVDPLVVSRSPWLETIDHAPMGSAAQKINDIYARAMVESDPFRRPAVGYPEGSIGSALVRVSEGPQRREVEFREALVRGTRVSGRDSYRSAEEDSDLRVEAGQLDVRGRAAQLANLVLDHLAATEGEGEGTPESEDTLRGLFSQFGSLAREGV